MPPALRNQAAITPAWLTESLTRDYPGAAVTKRCVGSVVAGTNRRAPVGVDYAAGSGPDQVFVKWQGKALSRAALIVLGAFMTEARLAEAGVSLPLEHATLLAGGVDWLRLRMAVVLTDVTTLGGAANDATRPLTLEEVADGLRGLARLHAAYWNEPLPPSLGFLRPWVLGRWLAPISAANLAWALRRLDLNHERAVLGRGLGVRTLEFGFRHSTTIAASGPQTLLHGDPHPGNTYALAGRRTGFYDWQLARLGNWSHDVGYFIVSSLEVADRREHERDLIDGYLAGLRDGITAARGAGVPSSAAAWELYRTTPGYGLGAWLHTYGATQFQPDDVSLATIERFAAAYRDLDTTQALRAWRP